MAYKLTYEELELELARVQVLADHRWVRLAAATELLKRCKPCIGYITNHYSNELLLQELDAFLANAPAAPTREQREQESFCIHHGRHHCDMHPAAPMRTEYIAGGLDAEVDAANAYADRERTDHERAVLEAVSAAVDGWQSGGIFDPHHVMVSELARREAAK